MRTVSGIRIADDATLALTSHDPRGTAVQQAAKTRAARDAEIVAAQLTALYGPNSDLHQALGLIPTEGATP